MSVRLVPDVGNLRARAFAAKLNYLEAVDLYAFNPSPELRRRVAQRKRVFRELIEAATIAETPV
jgi:hypothetical protein